jgi:hypothetical protein
MPGMHTGALTSLNDLVPPATTAEVAQVTAMMRRRGWDPGPADERFSAPATVRAVLAGAPLRALRWAVDPQAAARIMIETIGAVLDGRAEQGDLTDLYRMMSSAVRLAGPDGVRAVSARLIGLCDPLSSSVFLRLVDQVLGTDPGRWETLYVLSTGPDSPAETSGYTFGDLLDAVDLLGVPATPVMPTVHSRPGYRDRRPGPAGLATLMAAVNGPRPALAVGAWVATAHAGDPHTAARIIGNVSFPCDLLKNAARTSPAAAVRAAYLHHWATPDEVPALWPSDRSKRVTEARAAATRKHAA